MTSAPNGMTPTASAPAFARITGTPPLRPSGPGAREPTPAVDGVSAVTRRAENGPAVVVEFRQFRRADERANAQQTSPGTLSEEEQRILAEMKARDRKVHAHEQAHARVGGAYSGTPSYTTERGPDGAQYAVSGSTPIDVTPIPGDPGATLRKMETVKRAALAPADPSAQDRAVAARAEGERIKARADLADQEATDAQDPTRANGGATAAGSGQPSGRATRVQVLAAYGQANATVTTDSRDAGPAAGAAPRARPRISLLA